MIFIGIDPGKSGGIVALGEDGTVEAFTPMPETDADVYDFLRSCGQSARAALEFVRSSPQMGVTSAFTFGRGYGALRMALYAAGIPYDEVLPRTWQKALGIVYPSKSPDRVKKGITKARAQELFPRFPRMTHALADAFLLAEYARRMMIRTEVEEHLL
jgi:hypothetical protein